MSRIAVIACDHGLGHVRRSLLVVDELSARGHDVTLFAPEAAVARVRRMVPGASGATGGEVAQVVDFATLTTPQSLRRGDRAATRWHERLPGLDHFDRVVVDTLPEVLTIRPDAVLLAQFLWHDVLEDVDREYAERAETLAHTATLVIGSEPFAMPAVRSLPGFRAVGLYAGPDGRPGARPGAEALLIAGGATAAVRGPLERLVADLVRTGPVDPHGPTGWIGPGGTRHVHVDRELLPDDPPDWMSVATHTPAMYDEIAAAVVRPGLGTLTELLVRDAHIVCVREEGNSELAHNAAAIVELGRGQDVGASPRWPDLDVALQRTSEVREGTSVRPIRLDGAREAATLIEQERPEVEASVPT